MPYPFEIDEDEDEIVCEPTLKGWLATVGVGLTLALIAFAMFFGISFGIALALRVIGVL